MLQSQAHWDTFDLQPRYWLQDALKWHALTGCVMVPAGFCPRGHAREAQEPDINHP